MKDLQAYLRAVAAVDRQLFATGPFDVFIDPESDQTYVNYAIPRDGAEPTRETIEELILVMAHSGRVPRLEFLPATAPAAEEALRDFGFREELRTTVMTCAAEDAFVVEPPGEVQLQRLGPDAEGEVVEGFMRVIAEAFGTPHEPGGADQIAPQFARRIAVLAYCDEEVAAGGMCLDPFQGVTELAGIGVHADFRRRGIAAALTSELARLAFADGVELAFLTPGDQATGRVYERAGFAATDEMLHLVYEG